MRDRYMTGEMRLKALERGSTTKNDLGVDCISRADAQTELEMNASRYTIAKERGGMGQVEWSDQLIKVSDAVDIIRNLPSVTPQDPRWIPVSEKLPENKETVLVTFKHFVSGNTIGLGSVILLRGKPHWHVREQNLGTYDVLAWLPLPEPYREVKA